MPDLKQKEASANAKFFNDEGRKILTATLIVLYHIGMDFGEICKKIIKSLPRFSKNKKSPPHKGEDIGEGLYIIFLLLLWCLYIRDIHMTSK